MNPSGHDAIEEPDMWLCKHIINSPSYIGADLYLRKRKGWKYSADFLEHSLQKNPSDLVYGYDSELSIKLRRHKKIKKSIRLFLKRKKKMIKKIVVLIVTISIVLAGCNKNDILTSIGKEIGVDISSEKILEEKDDHGVFLVME